MATFIFDRSSTNSSGTYVQGKIEYSYTQNTGANTSTITMDLYVQKSSTTQTLTVATKGSWAYSMSIKDENGTTLKTFSGSASASVLGWVKIASGSYTVNHNSNGTKSISISGSVTGPSGTGVSGKTSSDTSSMITFKTIPRTTSLSSASDVTLGNKCSVKWTPTSSSFAYKLNFVCGSVSYTTGYITPGSTSAYTYTGYTMTVATWAAAMPSAYSATCTVTLYTYSNSSSSSPIGSDTTTFKLTLSNSVKPTISFAEPTMVNGWGGYYIQGKSKCSLSATFKAGAGSTIQSCTISGPGFTKTGTGTSLSGTTGFLNTSGTVTYTATITDGRTTVKATQTIQVQKYSNPTISLTASRSTSSGLVKLAYQASCSSVNSKNSLVSLKIYQKLSTAATWPSSAVQTIALSSSSASSTITLSGFESSLSYDFKAVVVDTYGSSSEAVSGTSSEFRILNINANKTGISIGKMSDGDVFDCNLPAIFLKQIEFGENIQGRLKTGQTTDGNGDIRNVVYLQTGQDVNGGSTMGLAVHNGSVYIENAANSGKVNLGSSGRKWNQLYAANGTIETSDKTVKQNIAEMSDAQEQLFNKLQPVTFQFANGSSGRTHYGFISQDVESALTDLNLTGQDFAGFCKDLRRDNRGNLILDASGEKTYDYALRYSEFIALNTYMIQRLQKENVELRTELNELKEKIANLNSSN